MCDQQTARGGGPTPGVAGGLTRPSPKRATATAYVSFVAKSTIERIAIPVGPFASHGLLSSFQAVPAISRWIHGVSSANSFMNQAAVIAPPPFPLPVLRMSAILLLIIS